MQWADNTVLNTERVCPRGDFDPADLLEHQPQSAFAEEVLAFTSDLSGSLLKSPRARKYSELVALGFWMRRANVNKMKVSFESVYGSRFLVGKGMVFHVAPSNVDSMFMYSFLVSLLAGNANIIRISSKPSETLTCLIDHLAEVIELHPHIRKRLLIVRYSHDDRLTAFFSNVCNVRVIWGGDETVCRIRAVPLPPHAMEIAFSGKFSVAVICARAWNMESEKSAMAKAFCLDCFTFGQQACASPKLVYWYGTEDEVRIACKTFWAAIEISCEEMLSYAPEPAEAMDRFVAVCSMAISAQEPIVKVDSRCLAYTRLKVSSLKDVNRDSHTGNGLFYEYADKDLYPLLTWFGDSDQTITSYGISKEQWICFLRDKPPKGICRIVRFGKALEFSPVWDGYDLVRCLSREIGFDI